MIFFQGETVKVIEDSGLHKVGDIIRLEDNEDGFWFACGKNDDYITEDKFIKLMNKQDEYTQKIILQLNELFKEDCENYINPDELGKDDNGTLFFHALGNLAGCYIYNALVGETDMLGYNHVLNRLCLQFAEKD